MRIFTLKNIMLVFSMFFSINSIAQTVQLGSGTTVSGTSDASPINEFYRSLHCQIVYTKAELNAAGISGAGTITQFGFYIAGAVINPLPNWTIKMKHTTATDPSVYDGVGLTTVHTIPSYNPPTGGFHLLTLNTPFNWNGNDNLLIDVCFDMVSAWTSSGQVRIYTPAVSNTFRYTRSDVSNQCGLATNTNSSSKPQAQLSFVPAAACVAPPTAGAASATPSSGCPSTQFSIFLSGSTFGSGLSYQWQSSSDNVTFTNIPGATGGGLNVTQSANTYYRAILTCSGQSDTSTSVLVTTTPFFQCYCSTNLGGGCTTTDNINTVSITGTTLNNQLTGCANNVASSYSVYPASGTTTATLTKGQSYLLNVTSTASSKISVWIDYDHSGSFDMSEWTQVSAASTANNPATVSLAVPITALSGNTGMRIRTTSTFATNGAADACTNQWSGETEDYTINIIPPSPIDLGVSALLEPATTGCYSANQRVRVRVKSYGSDTVDFSTNNLNVIARVAGVNPVTFPVLTISSGSILPNATFDTTITSTYNMSASGAYTFNAKTSIAGDGYAGNDSILPVTINISPGTASASNTNVCGGSSITLTLTGYTGTIQWQSSPDGTTWTNETGAGSTAASYTTTPPDTMMYRALVCGVMNSNSVTVNVSTVAPPVSSNVTRCGAGPVTLTASGSSTIQWFNTSVGGGALATGATFTPVVSSGTTYYVQGSNGSSYNLGKVSNTSGTGSVNNGYGLVFNVTTAFTLNTVKIYPVGTGNVTVGLLNSVGASLGSRTINITSGTGAAIVAYLGFYITPGSNYKLVVSSTSGITALYSDATGGTFPYTAAGVASITSGWNSTSTSTSYYYFYDWNILTGCASTRTPVTVTVTPADTVLISSSANAVCNGTPVTMTTSSTDTLYTYSWSPATGLNQTTGSSVVASPTSTQTYTVTATNTNSGCASSTVKALQVAVMPPTTASSTPSVICRGNSVQLNAATAGSQGVFTIGTGTATNTSTSYPAPYGNYYWGARHQILVRASELTAAGLTAGSIINRLGFDVTNTNGTDPLNAFEISMGNTNLTALTTFQTGLTTVKPGSTYAPVVGWNMHMFTTPYVWDGTSNLIIQTCFNNSSFTDNASTRYSTTTYTSAIYYRSDQSGVCSNTSVTTSTNRPNIRFGTMEFAHQWSPVTGLSNDTIKNPVATPLTTTDYIVAVTNEFTGCVSRDTVTVTVNQLPTPSLGADQGLCAGSTLTLNAGAGFTTYTWSTGGTTQTTQISAPGTYSVGVTDSNGCTNRDTIQITNNPVPVVAIGPDTIQCGGTVDITSTVNSNVTYSWSTGAFGTGITVSQSGDYTLTVTNAYGCTDTDTATVVIESVPVVELGTAPGFCPGGSVTLDAGNAGASYVWSTSASTQTINVSTGGTYHVTVTSPGGCVGSDTVIVTMNPVPVASAGNDETICAGQGVVLTASGGNFYDWSTGANTPSVFVTPLNTTSYTVLVENIQGCIDVDTVTVFVNNNPVASAGSDQAICTGGTVTLTATGGSSYLWNNGATTSSITVSPTVTTNYSVTVSDGNQCSDVDAVTVTVTPMPVANAGTDKFICEGSSAALSASGGATYSWSPATGLNNASVGNPIASPSVTTTYTVTASAGGGCSSQDVVVVNISPLPDASFSSNTNQAVVTFTNGSSNGVNYLWDFGDSTFSGSTDPVHQYIENGIFTVVLVVTNGCGSDTATTAVTITGIGVEESVLSKNTVLYPNPTKGSLTLEVSDVKSGTLTVKILDVNGQIVHEESVEKSSAVHKAQFEMSSYAKGVYFMQITHDAVSIMKKIILN